MPLSPKGFPVLLTFDLDAETMWTSRDPANAERPIILSQGAYGWKVGLGRVLDLLARHRIAATFFVPGLVIEQRPQAVESILEGGHEVAHHSWSHKWIVNMTEEEEREEMHRAFEIIEKTTGKAPRGYRSPAAEFSPQTLSLIREYGFGFSSNYFDDDSPYLHTIDGEESDIVEFPFHWVLDDAPFFNYSITPSGAHHAGAVGGAGSLEGGVRHALRGGPRLRPRHAPADHRPPLPAARAGRADPAHRGA